MAPPNGIHILDSQLVFTTYWYNTFPKIEYDGIHIMLGDSYTRFFVRKIGYINFVPKSVRRPSVRLSVRPSVTFLVIVSSSKPLDVAT